MSVCASMTAEVPRHLYYLMPIKVAPLAILKILVFRIYLVSHCVLCSLKP